MKDQIGSDLFPRTYRRGGQLVREFEDCIGFILEDGLYRRAGKNNTNGGHWPEKYESDELGRQGISVNRKLYRTVVKKEKPLLVYNAKQEVYYRLDQPDLLTGAYVGKESQQGRELVVTPFDAYVETDRTMLPEEIRDLEEL
jgi:hypothetical protein